MYLRTILTRAEEEEVFCDILSELESRPQQDEIFQSYLDELLSQQVYDRRTLKICRTFMYNEDDALDFQQELSLKVALSIFDKFKPNFGRPWGGFFGWFGRMATNAYCDRLPIFRANKGQTIAAQKFLRDSGLYAGEPSGKFDGDTLAGLNQYQRAEKIKVTKKLNAVTLEKMGIALTERQTLKTTFVDLEELLDLQDCGADPEILAMAAEIFDRVEFLGREQPDRSLALKLVLEGYSLREAEDEMEKRGFKCSHATIGNWVRDELRNFFSDPSVLFEWNHPQRPRPYSTSCV